jgi:hypothetical protein
MNSELSSTTFRSDRLAMAGRAKGIDTEARRVEIERREFVLVCVDLPVASDGADCEWALSYETRPPSWHFTVQMKGWMPADVVAEC